MLINAPGREFLFSLQFYILICKIRNFIKSQNRCIEVKSERTLSLEKFMSYKQNAAKSIGYEYEIWIYDHKGVKLREEK